MKSLTNICLDYIEQNGIDTRKIFEKYDLPKSITHRHPTVKCHTDGLCLNSMGHYEEHDEIIIEYSGVWYFQLNHTISEIDANITDIQPQPYKEKFIYENINDLVKRIQNCSTGRFISIQTIPINKNNLERDLWNCHTIDNVIQILNDISSCIN
jgi:hypothetical protein